MASSNICNKFSSKNKIHRWFCLENLITIQIKFTNILNIPNHGVLHQIHAHMPTHIIIIHYHYAFHLQLIRCGNFTFETEFNSNKYIHSFHSLKSNELRFSLLLNLINTKRNITQVVCFSWWVWNTTKTLHWRNKPVNNTNAEHEL